MKVYLVTGGAGFIGANFIHYMLNNHHDAFIINVDSLTYAGNLENLSKVEGNDRYHFVKADITDKQAIKEIFEAHDIDYVVNFAAESHVDRSIQTPEIFVKTNVLGTANLLNVAKDKWELENGEFKANKKFIQVSTDEVYGSLGEEGLFSEQTPLDPHSPYSASKASADMIVKSYFDTYQFPINITRCSNNYGPYQFPEKIIPLVINNCLNHKNIPLYGDGLNIRDWLYVEDHCKAIDLVIKDAAPGEIYNIGGLNEKTNVELVKTIIKYLHEHVDEKITEELITYVKDRKGHDRRYAIDANKIMTELGWTPAVNFETGIQETIKWYLENQDWLKNVMKRTY
ncbi:dTDP-glucose 4,6-dehydratase [Bacillus changyiensis]|uniref:dTDP-glucose 4,6-dehydratase n=1 Tax=Bacillus changyiensis TaxID=3004103 RepID=UPI0022E58978|nr:dTDP-glucose 4,6-dehydratase [Bacillus changyiensis]MDA1476597.1 dTDP-glucose 4,6-dehydratase [Bacillus changyiensis]